MSKAAAMDVAEKVIDATIDVAEEASETVETLERIPHLALNGTTRKQQIVILAATALVAGGVSGVVSHLATRKVLGAKFDAKLDEEMEAARKHYVMVREGEAKRPPQELAAQYQEQVSEYDGSAPRPEAPSVVEAEDGTLMTPELQNVFTENAVGIWNQAVEESKRSEDAPYVISKDEYFANEPEHQQETVTYYRGDDVIADMEDNAVPIHEVDITVGEDNLHRFGHGSEDERVVYVRNDRMEIDYEVVLHDGKFAHEVAGFIKHSDEGSRTRNRRR